MARSAKLEPISLKPSWSCTWAIPQKKHPKKPHHFEFLLQPSFGGNSFRLSDEEVEPLLIQKIWNEVKWSISASDLCIQKDYSSSKQKDLNKRKPTKTGGNTGNLKLWNGHPSVTSSPFFGPAVLGAWNSDTVQLGELCPLEPNKPSFWWRWG